MLYGQKSKTPHLMRISLIIVGPHQPNIKQGEKCYGVWETDGLHQGFISGLRNDRLT
jgi:hypothetical protein